MALTAEDFMAASETTRYYRGDGVGFKAAPGTPLGSVSHVWDGSKWVYFRGNGVDAMQSCIEATKEEAESE